MANTDLNQLFNQLLPMLLYASQRRRQDNLNERKFEAGQRQSAQDRAFEKQKYFTEQKRLKDADEVKQQGFMHEAFEAGDNDYKMTLIENNYKPIGVDDVEGYYQDLKRQGVEDLQLHNLDVQNKKAYNDYLNRGRLDEGDQFGDLRETLVKPLMLEHMSATPVRREEIESEIIAIYKRDFSEEAVDDTLDLFGEETPDLNLGDNIGNTPLKPFDMKRFLASGIGQPTTTETLKLGGLKPLDIDFLRRK